MLRSALLRSSPHRHHQEPPQPSQDHDHDSKLWQLALESTLSYLSRVEILQITTVTTDVFPCKCPPAHLGAEIDLTVALIELFDSQEISSASSQ